MRVVKEIDVHQNIKMILQNWFYSFADYSRNSEYDRYVTNIQTGMKDNVCIHIRITDGKDTFKDYVN